VSQEKTDIKQLVRVVVELPVWGVPGWEVGSKYRKESAV
jgi:hypothetical protein